MSASRSLLALLAGASICVACGGVFVGHKAVFSAQRYMQDALAYRAQAEDLKGRLAVAKGQLADAEKRIAEARAARPAPQVGTPGTLSRAARNYVNVKTPNGRADYWKGQCGIDRHGHAIFRSPEWSLRAGAIVLRNYARRYKLNTVEGIVKRFSTNNHAEYIGFLCRKLGVKPDEPFDVVKRMPELLPAMVRFESGRSVAPEHIAILDFLKES